MSKKVTTQSPKLYIGIDIHKKSWKVHFCTDITEGAGKSMPPDPKILKVHVSKCYYNYKVMVAYEAGCCGYTAARAFEEYGWETLVVNAADIPRPAKQGIIKTDKIDAKNIAKQLRSNTLKSITIPDIQRECLRSLTRHRTNLVKDLRRIKSRIKSHLLYFGIEIPEEYDNPNWSKSFLEWLDDIQWNYITINTTFSGMLAVYRFSQAQVNETSNRIRAYCVKQHKKDYVLLRSIPGIGPLTAAYILAEVGDIRRFSSFKKFAGYIGIIPGVHSSGENSRTTGVTPRCNRIIRSMIVESSWVTIRIDPALQNYYRSHAGKDSKAVIFKVARKLLSRMHAVIHYETPYIFALES